MNTIDFSILVQAPPRDIWKIIGDIEQNSRWQVICDGVSFITTNRRGNGTRWRSSNPQGNDHVVEITSWYENIGYEYIIVDGSPYRMNTGRIRLQETPDGTVIQWTFNYEVAGVLSGLRNTLSIKRSLENEIIDSLNNLYMYIKERPRERDLQYEYKSLMREALSAEERANYEPRYPTKIQDHARTPSGTPIVVVNEAPVIEEPPILDEDTKPNPAVQPSAQPEPQTRETSFVSNQEPDFLADIPDDTLLTPHTPDYAPEDEKRFMPPPIQTEEIPEPSIEPETPTVEEIDEEPVAKTPTPQQAQLIEPVKSSGDTSQISVFEVFGMPKPSETQELSAVPPKITATSQELPAVVASTQPHNLPEVVIDEAEEDIESEAENNEESTEPSPSARRFGARHIRRQNYPIRKPWDDS